MRVGGVKWHFITTCDSRYVALAVERPDFWGENEMNYLSDKRLCELLGTATLILVGCGAIAVGGFGSAFPVGILPVALAFGLAVMAMAYAIGPVSGCHINPAVTAAMWAAGRISSEEAIGYVVAQLIGGIIGAFILWVILKGQIAGSTVAGPRLGPRARGGGGLVGLDPRGAARPRPGPTLPFHVVLLSPPSRT